MIAVTSFAGKKVALFGLGGSGLASAQALVADFFAVADNTDDWRRSAHDKTISRQRRTGKDYSLVNAQCA